ncbi:TonB-dependent receptor [Sphingomonas oleivorans]|uniref:TonB-dependent receptor n=1 Tax=Sphingomonas oleivorans TaxID=1735121 RepID=A0A2T5G060_9SPHN|nr:TonB-dependent receptor [Sphingomonas oleivorans]PTQ12328.1 TonB-dependent receptor [Sphingomonas oleivorans]
MTIHSNGRAAAGAAFRATLLLASTMLTPLAAADAQEAAASPAPSAGLDEIVVTAQKREESLQKVPISITAISSERLEQLQVSNFTDYVKYLPSVSFTSFGPGSSQAFIRGVVSGEVPNHSASLPSVSTYLDEQPITTIQGALDVHVYDIARVETLSGPQGTLYGASSEAGTIRIITNKPELGSLEGAANAEVNSVEKGGTGYTGEGFVNLPVAENAAIRLVGWYEHDAGYIDNVPGSLDFPASGVTVNNDARVEDDYNDVDTYGGRAALRVELDDRWTVTPTIMAQKQRSHGIFAYDKAVGDLEVSHFFPEGQNDRWYQAALTIEGKIGSVDVTYAGSYLNRKIDSQSDYSDYSYFYDVLYGYTLQNDAGDNINPSQHITGRDRFSKISQELRFATDPTAPLRLVGGLFYQRQGHNIQQNYQVDGLASDLEVPGWTDTLWLTKQKRVDRDYAAFGEISYDLTDRLTATAGGRIFRYDNSLVGFFGFGEGYSSSTGVGACFGGADGPVLVAGGPCTNLGVENADGSISPKRARKTDFTHRLNLTYKFDADRLVYATWSRGYRPGGINRRGTLPPYEPDFLTNYELGFKTSWLDNRLRFNGALFYLEWKGIQFSFLGANGLTEIQNARNAHIKGAEAELQWVPTPGLTLSAAGAYTDAKLANNFCKIANSPDCSVDTPDADNEILAPDGARLPTTPKFKGNASARYEWSLGDFGAHLQGSLVYQSSSWNDLRTSDREVFGKRPDYALVDLTAGLTTNLWSVELFAKNVFDSRPDIYRYSECSSSICGGRIYTFTAQPRTIGLRVGRKFR